MSDHDFLFALDLSDEPHFDRMLSELASVVLRYAGYDPTAVDALTTEVRTALAGGAAAGRCEVRFRAGDGTLRIRVKFDGRPAWETARVLPAES